ncbi:hypothetical protein D0441_28085 [Priestia megaterium]|nr:hypothetical protein D0441_28085 [Priestia megaterium]
MGSTFSIPNLKERLKDGKLFIIMNDGIDALKPKEKRCLYMKTRKKSLNLISGFFLSLKYN